MQKLNYMQKHTKYAKKAIQKSRHAKFLGTWRARRGARYDFAYFAYLVYLCIFVHISHVLHILYIFAYSAYPICKNIEYMQNIQYMQKHTIYANTYNICKTNYTQKSASKVLFVAYTVYCCIFCIFCLVFNILHVYAFNIVSQRAQHTKLLGSEDDEKSEDIPEQPIEVDSAPEQGQAVHERAG